MHKMLYISEQVGEAGELTKHITDKDECIAIRYGIGDIVGRIYTDVIIPIIRQYPELDPDKNSKEKKD